MKPNQENNLRYSVSDMIKRGVKPHKIVSFLIGFIGEAEKQAAIDAIAKAERIQEISDELSATPIPSTEFDRYLAICAQRGAFAVYLTNLIDQMTPDQREIVAIQFDQNLFGTDEAMAKRFRDANNKETFNN